MSRSPNKNLARFVIWLGQKKASYVEHLFIQKVVFFPQVISQLYISINELVILKYENVSFK